MKYMDPFPLSLISKKNKINGVKLLLPHVLLCIIYYFHRSSWCCSTNYRHITRYPDQFSERSWWNSTRKLLPISDISRFNKIVEQFSNRMLRVQEQDWKKISQKTFHIPRKKMEKKREVFCHLGMVNGPGCTTAKLKTVYIVSFVKTSTIIICWITSERKIPSLKEDILTGNLQDVLARVLINMNPQLSPTSYAKTDISSKVKGGSFWNDKK